MQGQLSGRWCRRVLCCALGLAAGYAAVTAAWTPSKTPVTEAVTTVPVAMPLDGLQAARDMMRTLRVNSPLGCFHEGCIERDGAIACAMYAPGHRPRRNGEDTPNIGDVDEFTVENPNWKWSQPGGLGTPVAVTYSYSNLLDGGLAPLTNTQLQSAVQEALAVWAAQAPLIFTQIADLGPLPNAADTPYSTVGAANLRFGHHTFDGSSGVLAHGYYPSSTSPGLPGDLHFDDEENWAIAPGPGKIDFLEVAVHEIGHTLGLGHEDPPPTAVMNPFYAGRYSGLGTAFLYQDDIDGIKGLYITGATGGGGSTGCLLEQLVQKTKQSVQKTLPRKLLGAVEHSQPWFKDLRNYRDTVLNRTDVGRQLVGAYYKHGREVFTAITDRSELTGEALTIAVELHAAMVEDGRMQPNVTLPEATYNRAMAWLDRVEPLVSDDARQAIASSRKSLAGITQQTGSTITIRFEDAGR